MAKKISRNTFIMNNPPSIHSFASIVGQKESEGPLSSCFDAVEQDAHFGQQTWEQAESELLKRTVDKAITKGGLTPDKIDYMFAGDLLNQCISSTYGLRDFNIPILGIYGACSTMSEGLVLSSLLSDSGLGGYIIAVTSSHFCTAERQFRLPISYGGVRTPTAQWTCTASGAAILSPKAEAPYVKAVTIGKIIDLGITDANNMGAAMAPAAEYVKLTPARILVSYVVAGAVLGAFGLYDPLVELAGAGATVPLTGFGNNLILGVKQAINEKGFLGVFTGGFTASAAGVATAILSGLTVALIFKPKVK